MYLIVCAVVHTECYIV